MVVSESDSVTVRPDSVTVASDSVVAASDSVVAASDSVVVASDSVVAASDSVDEAPESTVVVSAAWLEASVAWVESSAAWVVVSAAWVEASVAWVVVSAAWVASVFELVLSSAWVEEPELELVVVSLLGFDAAVVRVESASEAAVEEARVDASLPPVVVDSVCWFPLDTVETVSCEGEVLMVSWLVEVEPDVSDSVDCVDADAMLEPIVDDPVLMDMVEPSLTPASVAVDCVSIDDEED